MNRTLLIYVTVSILVTLGTSIDLAAAPARGGGSGGVGNTYLEFAFLPIVKATNDYISEGAGGGAFEGEGDPGKTETTGYDLRTTLGYAIDGHWLIGLSYGMFSTTRKRSGESTQDTQTSIKEYGPTFGVLYSGWKLAYTHLLSSEWSQSVKVMESGATASDYTLTDTGASGYLLNFGYNFTLTSWLQLGPSLIYRSVTYSKQTKVNRVDPSGSYTDRNFAVKATQSDIQPYFTVIARF